MIEQYDADARSRIPQRGARRDMIALAEQNARHCSRSQALVDGRRTSERAIGVRARERMSLQRLPRSLVCFDISTTKGKDTVGSCCLVGMAPKRSEYRKFKVKTVEGTADLPHAGGVRRGTSDRRINETEAAADLIVIDGGKGQMSAAHAALAEGLPTTADSLASATRRSSCGGEERSGHRGVPALRLLQQARDEAHRFAVTTTEAEDDEASNSELSRSRESVR